LRTFTSGLHVNSWPEADIANLIRVDDDIRIQQQKIRTAIPNRGAFLLALRAVVFLNCVAKICLTN
tara:strand:- start:6602 stop:6799 length:198 start_codon:yes stop_codon:yes gene_type:complete